MRLINRKIIIVLISLIMLLLTIMSVQADWVRDDSIIAGVVSHPNWVEYNTLMKNSTLYMWARRGAVGSNIGYDWNGTGFVQDNNLGHLSLERANFGAASMFELEGSFYIVGYHATFGWFSQRWTNSGFNWDNEGVGEYPGTIRTGMTYPGTITTPGTAIWDYEGNTYYMNYRRSSDMTGGMWFNGSWNNDTSHLNGLSFGQNCKVTTFTVNSGLYMLIGCFGTFIGYQWDGSTWQSDNNITQIIGGTQYNWPEVFVWNNTAYMILYSAPTYTTMGFWYNGTLGTPAIICGNNITEAGEACDGTDLANQTCVSFGYDYGTLACSGTCTFNKTGCHTYGGGPSFPEPVINPVLAITPGPTAGLKFGGFWASIKLIFSMLFTEPLAAIKELGKTATNFTTELIISIIIIGALIALMLTRKKKRH